jgi:tryptophanyl-tRNA synthetase
MARRLAWRFNNTYGSIFTIPQAKLNEARTVPGIDGEKMSKSYGNAIPLFGDREEIRKLMFSIRTDSTPVAAPKDPESCRLYALLKLLADSGEAINWADRYRNGGLSYRDVKQRLVELYQERFGAARERRIELEQRVDRVEEILQEGAAKAHRVADRVMAEVREAVGIPSRPRVPLQSHDRTDS